MNEYLIKYAVINDLHNVLEVNYDSTEPLVISREVLNYLFGPYYKLLNQDKDRLIEKNYKLHKNDYAKESYLYRGHYRDIYNNMFEESLVFRHEKANRVSTIDNKLKAEAAKLEGSLLLLKKDALFCWWYLTSVKPSDEVVDLLNKFYDRRIIVNPELDEVDKNATEEFKEIFFKYSAFHLIGRV